MKAAFYLCLSVVGVCFLGVGVSAVLVDHGLAPRVVFDLFCMVGIVFCLPSVFLAWVQG